MLQSHEQLPLYGGREPLHTRRGLLVGDAAGLVDPLLGEGIRYAVRSARLAAEAIGQGDLSGYSAAVNREIGRSLGWAKWVARLQGAKFDLQTCYCKSNFAS